MSDAAVDSTVSAIALHVSDNFGRPWFNYRGKYEIDDRVANRLRAIYASRSKLAVSDVDLSRLNIRRALCQIGDAVVVAATLADPPKRLYRNDDFPLLCGYIGEPALSELRAANGQTEIALEQRLLAADALAQLAAWHPSLRPSVDSMISSALANFAMQSRILNGRLSAVAVEIPNPSSDLAMLIADSERLPQYFDKGPGRVASFPASRLFVA